MLFNSYEFLFLFLPVTLLGYLAAGRISRGLALGWLIAASLVFYAWWRPVNVPIIGVSLAINFSLAVALRRLTERDQNPRLRGLLLTVGIVFNLLFLGYFKYTNFVLGAVNDVAGTDFVFHQVILPLGISFITFQKIAFLVDVHARRVEQFTLRDYLLFVLFFPQLIAGPIVHYREMMPQFEANTRGPDRDALAAGLTLLCFGLFKKVVLADGIALEVSPIFALANDGANISLIPAWVAAVGYTLQIYFDFSGYSDMASGLARCFGVRLPLNFYSPLQASNIIDFWARWHVTLTRFLTAYLYNPLLLWLTRRRMARGGISRGGYGASPGAFLQLLAWPTLFTMFISGLWHGAGYTFLLWGLLHGLYLVVNHAWRVVVAKRAKDKVRYQRVMVPVGFVLTFLAVAVAMVLFRAPTLASAGGIYAGMVGAGGVELPQMLIAKLGAAGLPVAHITPVVMSSKDFLVTLLWVLGLLAVALLLPNTQQVMARFEPVLGIKDRPANTGLPWTRVQWAPTAGWAVVVALLGAFAVMRVGGPSEFLYWQF